MRYADVFAETLALRGEAALASSRVLLNCVMDVSGARWQRENRVLSRVLDDAALAPFARANTTTELATARAAWRNRLVNEELIAEASAETICDGLADGIATWRGFNDIVSSDGKRDLSAANVGAIAPQRFTGKPLVPNPVITIQESTLKDGREHQMTYTLQNGKDYRLAYFSNVGSQAKATEARIEITGMGRFVGSRSVRFTILAPTPSRGDTTGTGSGLVEHDLAKATVDAIPIQIYTGRPITPKPAVRLNGRVLENGRDYRLTYQSNVGGSSSVSVAEVVVEGTESGEYYGTNKVFFTILVQDDYDLAEAIVDDIPDQTYTGGPITPGTTVRLNGHVLENGKDYRLTYSNNVGSRSGVSIARIEVEGIGSGKNKTYKGTNTVFFRIVPPADNDISMATVDDIPDQTYTGRAITPKPGVRLNGRVLENGRDYRLRYFLNVGNPKETTEAIIEIEGIGHYAGNTRKVTFQIVPRQADAAEKKRGGKAGHDLALYFYGISSVIAISGFIIGSIMIANGMTTKEDVYKLFFIPMIIFAGGGRLAEFIQDHKK